MWPSPARWQTEADELRGTDPDLAMQLSLAAYRISPTSQALSSLLDSTDGPAVTRVPGTVGAEVSSVALSPDGALLATGTSTVLGLGLHRRFRR